MSRKERERLYLSEYMRETWPEGNFILNVCLGPVPDYLLETHGPAKVLDHLDAPLLSVLLPN